MENKTTSLEKELNMKSKLSYMLAAVVAMAVIGSGFVYAQSRGLSILEGIPGITLDEAQKAKLQARDAEHQKAMIKLQADYKMARVDGDALLKDKNFKKDAAEKQIRKMMAVQTDMELQRLERIHELRGVLTDAQWKVFTAHAGAMGCGMGGRGMGGGCGMMMNGCGMMGGKAGMGPHHKGMKGGMGAGMGKGMANCPYMNNTDADKTK